jgi:hypothetical protein
MWDGAAAWRSSFPVRLGGSATDVLLTEADWIKVKNPKHPSIERAKEAFS